MTAPHTSPRADSAPAPISLVDLEALEESAGNGTAHTHEWPRQRRDRGLDNGRSGTAHARGALKRDVAAARRSVPPADDRLAAESDEVDLAGMDSFPASDPPSFWTHDPAPAQAQRTKKETA